MLAWRVARLTRFDPFPEFDTYMELERQPQSEAEMIHAMTAWAAATEGLSQS